MTASKERAGEAAPVFSPLATTALVAVGGFVALLTGLSTRGSRALLLAPVDGEVRAALTGLGVFVGVWVAAALCEAWPDHFSPAGPAGNALDALLGLAVPVALLGWCGFVFARQAAEWRAFHGLQAPAVQERFTVAGVSRGRRGSRWLNLAAPGTGAVISINCATHDCRGLDVGSALTVRVETGRGGVRRAVFPAG